MSATGLGKNEQHLCLFWLIHWETSKPPHLTIPCPNRHLKTQVCPGGMLPCAQWPSCQRSWSCLPTLTHLLPPTRCSLWGHRPWSRGCPCISPCALRPPHLLPPCVCAQSGLPLRAWGLEPSRLLCPSDSPGKHTRVGCHFSTRGSCWPNESNSCPLHCRQVLFSTTWEVPGTRE